MKFRIENVTIEDRGWAGHFCAAQYCLFRRNTRVYNDLVSIIISTVGNYQPPSFKNDPNSDQLWKKQIGYERFYETMVFHSLDDFYKDADVSRQIGIESNWQINTLDEESDHYANKMHDNVVDEIVSRMNNGDLFTD